MIIEINKDIELEKIFEMYNNIDGESRNAKLQERSMSIGDIISIDEEFFIVNTTGFTKITIKE